MPKPVWAQQSGQLAVLTSEADASWKESELVIFNISDEPGLQETARTEIIVGATEGLPFLVTTEGRICLQFRSASSMGAVDIRQGRGFKVLEGITTIEEFSPQNILETTQWQYSTLLHLDWSPALGVIAHSYDPGDAKIKVWVGRQELVLADTSSPVVVQGSAYIDGKLGHVGLAEDGSVLYFDTDTGRFVSHEAYRPIGESLRNFIGDEPLDKLPRFVMAQNIVLIKWSPGFVAIDSDGETLVVERSSSMPEHPVESAVEALGSGEYGEIDDQSIEQAAEDVLLGRPEQSEDLEPLVVDTFSFIVPISDTQVGIVDTIRNNVLLLRAEPAE